MTVFDFFKDMFGNKFVGLKVRFIYINLGLFCIWNACKVSLSSSRFGADDIKSFIFIQVLIAFWHLLIQLSFLSGTSALSLSLFSLSQKDCFFVAFESYSTEIWFGSFLMFSSPSCYTSHWIFTNTT